MKRRSTVQISLTILGLVAVSGCGSERQRDVYRNRADCLKDFGGNEKDCQEPPPGHSLYGTGYYFGPHYSGTPGIGRGAHALSSVSVPRGGFGFMSGFHGSGG